MEADRVLCADEDHAVERLLVVVLRRGVKLLVRGLAEGLRLVGHLEEFGDGRGGVAGADVLRHDLVLDGVDLLAHLFGRLLVALLACLQVVLQGAHDAVVGDLLPVHLGRGHVAVRAGHTRLPVHAVVGEELELRVADEGELEAGDTLGPLAARLVAPQLLDDVLDGDAAPLAPVPREEDVRRLHVLILRDAVGDVALGASQGTQILLGELGLVHTELLKPLAECEAAGDLEGHGAVVVTVDAGNAQGLVLFGDLAADLLVGFREVIPA